mmetsp:Transcript_29610/g.54620  ORF Transcript_29610/g.54620 Transcript_29610/m.54620 type:complete len:160 (-) Transcript_29610:494-973(-)
MIDAVLRSRFATTGLRVYDGVVCLSEQVCLDVVHRQSRRSAHTCRVLPVSRRVYYCQTFCCSKAHYLTIYFTPPPSVTSSSNQKQLSTWVAVLSAVTDTKRTSRTSSHGTAEVYPNQRSRFTTSAPRRPPSISSPSCAIWCATRNSRFRRKPSRRAALP